MKLLQFHQDHRPPYWGTWSKTSREVTGRRPLGRDVRGLLNYDYDSEGGFAVGCTGCCFFLQGLVGFCSEGREVRGCGRDMQTM